MPGSSDMRATPAAPCVQALHQIWSVRKGAKTTIGFRVINFKLKNTHQHRFAREPPWQATTL